MDIPPITPAIYKAGRPVEGVRAKRVQIFQIMAQKNASLVDVHSPDESTGKVIAPPGMTETA